jgi:tight adherence protein C
MSVIVLFGIGLFFVLGLVFLGASKTQTSQSVKLAEVARETRARRLRPNEQPSSSILVNLLAKPFSLFRGLISSQPNPDVARRLALAGYREPEHSDIFLGSRLAVPAALGVATALLISDGLFFFFAIALVVGFFAPDFWLNAAMNRRRRRISESLPDGLDLMSICLEAGLGLDQAIVRVGEELRLTARDLSEELLQINFEQRAGVPRLDSWRSCAERVGLDDLRQFVAMLVHTERFGTPIATALSQFSQAIRMERRQKAEELGAKAAIKMVFPMAFFIFPTVFIVIVGPAIVGIVRNLAPLLK